MVILHDDYEKVFGDSRWSSSTFIKGSSVKFIPDILLDKNYYRDGMEISVGWMKSRDRCFLLLRTCFHFRHGNRDFVFVSSSRRSRGGIRRMGKRRGVTNNVAVWRFNARRNASEKLENDHHPRKEIYSLRYFRRPPFFVFFYFFWSNIAIGVCVCVCVCRCAKWKLKRR